ncbi:DnaD domain-containing protein [Holzapfeliella floricola]|uniref:DNA replication protein DnaD n=1 Tax=Holzapfeliella floricola DSM 23037 = JCM 16512 TaxID=1423744 RepID=A0A0R2DTG4_9LACO|nr:DnaD domain protein [Holzapfeliella floricola]KRN03738.1 DNA replication protein DnaD [Holzapfeliella floricola DSM 23037 = JCM 16512]
MENKSLLLYQQGFSSISQALLNYYTKINISDLELIVLLQLEKYRQNGDFFPSNNEISQHTNLSAHDIGQVLQSLINKELIEIIQTTDKINKIETQYRMDNLYEKLIDYMDNYICESKSETEEVLVESDHQDGLSYVMRQFEIEFGRLLSPIEREMIQSWLIEDGYNEEIVILALRESVLAQVYNFKYIDKILLNWQKMNLKTPQQVKQYQQKF